MTVAQHIWLWLCELWTPVDSRQHGVLFFTVNSNLHGDWDAAASTQNTGFHLNVSKPEQLTGSEGKILTSLVWGLIVTSVMWPSVSQISWETSQVSISQDLNCVFSQWVAKIFVTYFVGSCIVCLIRWITYCVHVYMCVLYSHDATWRQVVCLSCSIKHSCCFVNVLVWVPAPPPTAAADVTSSYTGVSADVDSRADDGVGAADCSDNSSVSSSGRATASVHVVTFLFLPDVCDPLMLMI